MRRLCATILPVAALASAAQAEPRTFQGGIFDGLRAERAADGTGRFLPGVVEPRPPSDGERIAVESFLNQVRRRAELGAVPVLGAVHPGTQDMTSTLRRIVGSCTGDAPYRIGADLVRIGWLCRGRLEWFSLFTISGARVREVRVARALVPVVIELPRAKSVARSTPGEVDR